MAPLSLQIVTYVVERLSPVLKLQFGGVVGQVGHLLLQLTALPQTDDRHSLVRQRDSVIPIELPLRARS